MVRGAQVLPPDGVFREIQAIDMVLLFDTDAPVALGEQHIAVPGPCGAGAWHEVDAVSEVTGPPRCGTERASGAMSTDGSYDDTELDAPAISASTSATTARSLRMASARCRCASGSESRSTSATVLPYAE